MRETEPKHPDGGAAKFAHHRLDRVVHEPARLSILASLASHPKGLLFADLKELCALTDGNLSRHLQTLHDSELVEIWKGSRDNRPQTVCRITDFGRKRLLDHVAVLENVVADALTARRGATSGGDVGVKGLALT